MSCMTYPRHVMTSNVASTSIGYRAAPQQRPIVTMNGSILSFCAPMISRNCRSSQCGVKHRFRLSDVINDFKLEVPVPARLLYTVIWAQARVGETPWGSKKAVINQLLRALAIPQRWWLSLSFRTQNVRSTSRPFFELSQKYKP